MSSTLALSAVLLQDTYLIIAKASSSSMLTSIFANVYFKIVAVTVVVEVLVFAALKYERKSDLAFEILLET